MKTIVEMAREAGLLVIGTADGGEAVYTWPQGITDELERFAALVADAEAKRIHDEGMVTVGHMREQIAAEREACAKVCDGIRYSGYCPPENGSAPDYYDEAAEECAAAIRARGNT